jgi:hypothetical protein
MRGKREEIGKEKRRKERERWAEKLESIFNYSAYT